MKRAKTTGAAHAAPGGAPRVALGLWIVLARAYGAMARHAADDAARHGLTLPEFGILEALYHKGPLLLGELQKRVLVSSGGTTFLVDRLVAKGFVERRSCDTDRRARYAALTRAGETLIGDVFPGHAARIADAMRGLTQKEQKQATALIRKLGLAAAEAGAAAPAGTRARKERKKRVEGRG